MKIFSFKKAVLIILAILLVSGHSVAITVNISVSNFVFTPSVVNVQVGDTIKWNWISGSHTTTCNGQLGTVRPGGAAPWNAPLNNNNTSFRYVISVPGKYLYVCEPHAPDMSGVINAVISSVSQINETALDFKLSQNYPNPFNPETEINFSIPVSSEVNLEIYNSSGQLVDLVVNEKLSAGNYNVKWNAFGYTSGVYFYVLRTENFSQTRKMLLIK
ncbi:MAG: T9SS type A sorting domain-containing protein [Bacteroidetes bacterium]|nr:T9SS type A sorting domain-containing protein [Bacteroidota bacterium]